MRVVRAARAAAAALAIYVAVRAASQGDLKMSALAAANLFPILLLFRSHDRLPAREIEVAATFGDNVTIVTHRHDDGDDL